jgi:hypothetical protein
MVDEVYEEGKVVWGGVCGGGLVGFEVVFEGLG